MSVARPPALLLFNLATDDDDPLLGFTSGWINALAKHCSSIDVVTMTAGRVNVAGNVRVFSIGKEKGYTESRRAVEFYRILGRRLREKPVDAGFFHMTPLFAVMAAPILKPRGVKLVLWYAHKAISLTLRAAESLADQVVTPTRESFPFPSHKLTVVGHGVDTTLFTPGPARESSAGPFKILVAGRVAPIKRVEVLIEAVRQLVLKGDLEDIQVRLVGPVLPKDTGYAENLRRTVISAGLQGRIDFVGPRPFRRMPDEYRAADLLVSTSQTGSADKVVLEAMACEVPVVTSNPAFVPVLSRWSGLLLAPPGDPAALALRMRQMIQMRPAERRGLGRELREVVKERHSLDRLARTLILEVF